MYSADRKTQKDTFKSVKSLQNIGNSKSRVLRIFSSFLRILPFYFKTVQVSDSRIFNNYHIFFYTVCGVVICIVPYSGFVQKKENIIYEDIE